MSRGAGLCRRCGGPKRGRGARVSAPIADCAECGDPICERHATFDADRGERGAYVCTKCTRKARVR